VRVTYIAECFWPDARQELVDQAAERVRRSAAELTSDEKPVDYAGSLFVPGDDVVFYLFESVSADAVREACERAGIPFERVVESVWREDELVPGERS
jgi:hypothetical protein